MELPESINVQVEDDSGNGVEGIIVQLKVEAGTKNPYTILSPKTDINGKALISKNDFIGQFKDHWEMGLMDYNGNIETANNDVEVSLYNPQWAREHKESCIAWPLLKNEIPNWSSREEQYEYLISCNNSNYKAKNQLVNISESNNIIVKVATN